MPNASNNNDAETSLSTTTDIVNNRLPTRPDDIGKSLTNPKITVKDMSIITDQNLVTSPEDCDNIVTINQGLLDRTSTISTSEGVDSVTTTNVENIDFTTNSDGVDDKFTTGSEGIDNEVTTNSDGVDDKFTTGSEGIDNEVTTNTDVDDKFTTGSEGIDNEVTTNSDGIDDKFTTGSEGIDNEVTTNSDGIDDKFTTGSEGIDNEVTTNSDGVDDKFTTGSDGIDNEVATNTDVDDKFTTGSEGIDDEVTTNSDGIDDKFTTGSGAIGNEETTNADDIDNILKTNTESIDESFTTIAYGIDNESTTNLNNQDNHVITMHNSVDEIRTTTGNVLENAVESGCGENVEDHPIDTLYTNDIELRDPGYVNSELQHEYTVGTKVELTCKGLSGSDGLAHKWLVASDGDPCNTINVPLVIFSPIIELDGCTYIVKTNAILTIPNDTRTIVVWCLVSDARTAEEECANITENSLTKSVVIIPGLSLTANTLSWQNFVWADGSPLTFREVIDDLSCFVCLEDYPVVVAMVYRESLRSITWVPALDDTHVACEWRMEHLRTDRYGLSLPTGNYDYTGNKAMFHCHSGEYISAVYLCDGTSDCNDVTDEMTCDRGCLGATFQCDYGACIPASKSCDFIKDCADGSDELLCNHPSCDDGYWQCANKECIPVYDICDGDLECVDGSDESHELCTDRNVLPSEYTFRCLEPNRILPLARKCDGVHDCKSDESSCSSFTTYFSCSSWVERTNDVASSEVSVDYGMPQYGKVSVHCLISNMTVDTTWTFLPEQDVVIPYEVVSIVSNAFWFETKWSNRQFQEIAYQSRFQQKAMLAAASSCVQYIRPCSYFVYIPGVVIEWTNGDGDLHSMEIADYEGCFGLYLHYHNRQPSYVPCKNGLYYDPSLQCLMNFDPTGEPMACRDLTHLENCDRFTCPEYYVKCPDSFCIHMKYICDGTGHCPNREDELDCDSPNCTNHYRCRGGRPCIPFSYICDGVRHCPLGDDESHCEETCPTGCSCQTLAFTCESESNDLHLSNITTEARWISIRTSLRNITNHFPLSFPLLTTLILKSCDLQGLTVDGTSIFQNMAALRHLDMSSNRIQSLPDGIFAHVKELRNLILSGNPISSLSNGALSGLKTLKVLVLSHSNIKQLATEVFSGVQQLQHLDLSANLISRLPNGMFSKLNALQTLKLNDNPLVYIDVNAFSKLYSLSYLQLSKINTEIILSGVFKNLHSLTDLNLSSSGIYNLGLRSFQSLKKLESLDIQNNYFEVQEFMFDGLHTLEYLYADSYKMCCIKPKSVLDENCFAPQGLISSCSDLIGSDFLRGCLWIIGILALVGNLFVIIYRLAVDKIDLKKSHSIFIINLSMSDFIMGIYMLIVASVDTRLRGRYVVNDQNWRQGALCVTAGCLSVISSEMSTFAILMITVDRFIAIVFPLSLRKITWKTAVFVSMLLWVVSLMLAIVPHAMFQSYFKGQFYSRSSVCLALPLTGGDVPGREYSIAIFIALNGFIFLMILILQLIIHRHCRDSGTIATTQNRKREIALARSLFLVVASDFLCWFPIGVIGVWTRSGGTVSADVYAWVMVFVLPINSAINPFLYTYIYIKRKVEINFATKGANRLPDTSKGRQLMTEGFNASNNLKEIYFSQLFRPHKSYVCMEQYAKGYKVSPTQAYQISRMVIMAVSFLHRRNVIHGNVSDRNVYITNNTKAVKRARLMLDQRPIGGDHDSRSDILQYGHLVKKLLRILNRR
ncbi:uncharacterized protein LOC132543479 [Ylistrum balloti]|uniref:uncharacterized protein LOC132543479 n=1 Tax=Ylistrum balloti TaxID=509963 RepID=UPI0029058754|nr:uncharacterized protein LOC132543479 [Ylistrum balloti]